MTDRAKKITELTSIGTSNTSVANGDILIIEDISANTTKSVTFSTLQNNLNSRSKDIIPEANGTYNLGNSSFQWNSLYVTNNTIYIGGTPLSVDANGSLLVNNVPVSGGGDVTGNITISSTNSQINFVANSSGDGQGYSTIELIPDANLDSDQYLIIDPTAPQHIHIRAGGQQDDSSAELYLGGEATHVKVIDGTRLVSLSRTDDVSLENFSYTSGVDFTSGTWYTESGSYFVEFTSANATLTNHVFQLGDNDQNYVTVYWNSGSDSYTLKYAGFAENVSGNTYRVQVDVGPTDDETVTIEDLFWEFFEQQTSSIEVASDIQIETDQSINIYSSNEFRLYNYSSENSIRISTDYDNVGYTWEYKPNGMLQLPGGGNLNIKSDAPTTSNGASGDLAGMIAFSNTHIYYCVADYDGVTADIWRRVEWSATTSW